MLTQIEEKLAWVLMYDGVKARIETDPITGEAMIHTVFWHRKQKHVNIIRNSHDWFCFNQLMACECFA